jgi:hypothetical protein
MTVIISMQILFIPIAVQDIDLDLILRKETFKWRTDKNRAKWCIDNDNNITRLSLCPHKRQTGISAKL